MCDRNFEALIPDAPELIHNYLEGELDASCKRNAFMMLIHADRVSLHSDPTYLYFDPSLYRRELWITSPLALTKSTSSTTYSS